MNTGQSLDEFFVREYESVLQRIAVLERRRGLAPLDFGMFSVPKDIAEHANALREVVRWKIERLESLEAMRAS